jgi:hypothetical protein
VLPQKLNRDLSQDPEIGLQSGGVAAENSGAAGQSDRCFCIPSWRIFWLTMMNRALPDAPPKLAFTALEIHLLDQLAKGKDLYRLRRTSVSACLVQLARLGGYLARAGDSPPGN